MSVEDVEGWMEVGELEGDATRDGIVLSWAELVSFAMGFWEQEAIEEALGADAVEAIPELLRLCNLEVRIPRMEVVALEKLAARDGKSVDAVLAGSCAIWCRRSRSGWRRSSPGSLRRSPGRIYGAFGALSVVGSRSPPASMGTILRSQTVISRWRISRQTGEKIRERGLKGS